MPLCFLLCTLGIIRTPSSRDQGKGSLRCFTKNKNLKKNASKQRCTCKSEVKWSRLFKSPPETIEDSDQGTELHLVLALACSLLLLPAGQPWASHVPSLSLIVPSVKQGQSSTHVMDPELSVTSLSLFVSAPATLDAPWSPDTPGLPPGSGPSCLRLPHSGAALPSEIPMDQNPTTFRPWVKIHPQSGLP